MNSRLIESKFGLIASYLAVCALSACSAASFEKLPDPPAPVCNNFYQSCNPVTTPSGTKVNVFDYVEVAQERKVDILFVDDNSQSMQDEQAQMAQAFTGFIDSLAGINWRIGITTTDVKRDSTAGRLLDFQPGLGLYVLSSTIPDNAALFSKTIKRSEIGSGDERAIYATNLLIDRDGNSSEPDFMREKTHLAVVILSDEDERSTGSNLEELDKPATLVSKFEAKYRGEKTLSVHSMIIKPGDTECLLKQKGQNTTGREGKTYAELSGLTGGYVGSICSGNYTDQLSMIANNISVKVDTYTLACAPIESKMTLEFDSKPVAPSDYTLGGETLILKRLPPPGAKIHFKYECNVQ